jgi:long-chain acyl-CoA synthetase
VCIGRRPDDLAADLAATRAQILVVEPGTLARICSDLGSALAGAGNDGPHALGLRRRRARRLAARAIRGRLGGALRTVVCGGSRLDPALPGSLAVAGIEVVDAYVLAELAAPATLAAPDERRHGGLGPPLPGILVEATADGELLVAGAILCDGYEAAGGVVALPGGVLATGDAGRLDEAGRIWLGSAQRPPIEPVDSRR